VVVLVRDFEDLGGLEACPNRFRAFWYLFLKNNDSYGVKPGEGSGRRTPNSSPKKSIITHNQKTLQQSLYPLIIFPEGLASNGRGVLRFVADLSCARRNQRIHLTCTKFSSALFTIAYPLQGSNQVLPILEHLWRLCSQLGNQLTNRTILPAALFSSTFDLPAAAADPIHFNRTLQQIVSALGHLRPLNSTANDKISFLKSLYHQ
jgi:hypothetical protein